MGTHEHCARPVEVLRATFSDTSGDTADQADRLAMIMEAEALEAALHGRTGEGELDGYPCFCKTRIERGNWADC
jgi:hypothetical protein